MRKTKAAVLNALSASMGINRRDTKRHYTRVPCNLRQEWLQQFVLISRGVGENTAKAIGPCKAASLLSGDFGALSKQDYRKVYAATAADLVFLAPQAAKP